MLVSMFSSPERQLAKRWRALLLSGLVFAMVASLGSLILPLEYRADGQILIISRSRFGVDPYTVAKSAERVGENIAQVVSTDDFYNKVMALPQYSLDTSKFVDVSDRVRRKRWGKTVSASVIFGTGVLNINAYHTSPQQAVAYASAAADALVANSPEYVGGDVTFKIVNSPVATPFPVRPNVIVNGLLGFGFGILFMAILVVRKRRIVS